MKDKIIGWVVVWVLTIAGVTVSITQEDVGQKYLENTGKELNISADDLVSYDDIIDWYKDEIHDMWDFYASMDCEEYDYDFYYECPEAKKLFSTYIDSLNQGLVCFETANTKYDLAVNDLNQCINAMNSMISSTYTIYDIFDWWCDENCEQDVEAYEYNKAMFEVYLEKSQ